LIGCRDRKGGCDIKSGDAWAHVFGYTIVNDVTARDRQRNHKQWFLSKGLDTFCPMGPWIKTVDELDATDLTRQMLGKRRAAARREYPRLHFRYSDADFNELGGAIASARCRTAPCALYGARLRKTICARTPIGEMHDQHAR
jgi:hypothetical protein